MGSSTLDMNPRIQFNYQPLTIYQSYVGSLQATCLCTHKHYSCRRPNVQGKSARTRKTKYYSQQFHNGYI